MNKQEIEERIKYAKSNFTDGMEILLEIIERLEQENKRLTNTNKSYKGIINKQNKINNEMAEYIVELIKFNNPEELRETKEIKQYFEKKVEVSK